MSTDPKGLRLKLHAVRCVYDSAGRPVVNETPSASEACGCCLRAFPVPGADEPGAWLVRPFHEGYDGRPLEVIGNRWVCHLCLSMWDDGINAEGVYDL